MKQDNYFLSYDKCKAQNAIRADRGQWSDPGWEITSLGIA